MVAYACPSQMIARLNMQEDQPFTANERRPSAHAYLIWRKNEHSLCHWNRQRNISSSQMRQDMQLLGCCSQFYISLIAYNANGLLNNVLQCLRLRHCCSCYLCLSIFLCLSCNSTEWPGTLRSTYIQLALTSGG